MWYPQNKQELENVLDKYFKQKSNLKKNPKKINGLIVPHAGYEYSGAVAGKAFSLLKNKKIKKAVIIGPSHYVYLNDAITTNTPFKTPLGSIKLFNKNFLEADILTEHSIGNQIPFLQKLNFKEILPIMIGQITNEQAKEIAKKISKIKAVYIFSTDLSHFQEYNKAVQSDTQTINIIENLDIENLGNLDACGLYPLLVLFHLCKIKKTKPHLIEYKNSGDITGDKSGVVGYASFWF